MPRRRLLAVCAFAILPVFVACGDDDGGADADPTPGGSATQGQSAVAVSTASPNVSGPASKYAILLDDIGIRWLTDVVRTLVVDKPSYAASRDVFETESEGMRLLNDWGYEDGYEVHYVPEGRDEAVLVGAGYYITVETHRFKNAEGAQKAYQYYADSITSGGAPPAQAQPIGNKSIAFTGYSGKIPRSTVTAEFEQIIFVRGNMVSIVLATGAQGFMKLQFAWDIAQLVDEKILGERPAVEPTPTSNYKTPTPEPKP